jgi:type II secretory ATPase GspE/PulE/Tfp pilus assembly ATPase PilB-like protein
VTLRVSKGPFTAADLQHLCLLLPTQRAITQGLVREQGLTLVVGPEDGPWRLAYAMCRHLEANTRRIVTVESCIEARLANTSQVWVKGGASAADMLRAAVVQDPDVLMVSVPLDHAMRSQIVKAAEHRRVIVVVETDHVTSEVLDWIQSGARAVLNLVVMGHSTPTVCRHCGQPHKPGGSERESLALSDEFKANRGMGCLSCRLSGHHPRLDWHALQVEEATRSALRRVQVPSELRHVFMPDWMATAKERLERGTMDCDTYRQVLSGLL